MSLVKELKITREYRKEKYRRKEKRPAAEISAPGPFGMTAFTFYTDCFVFRASHIVTKNNTHANTR